MAEQFPFLANISTGDLIHFAPNLQERLNPYFAGGEQRQINPYDEQYSRLGEFALGATAASTALYDAHRMRLDPMDYIHAGIRIAEDFSPSQILRTFNAGDFFSQFTSANSAERFISPQQVRKLRNTPWFGDLLYRTGPDAAFSATIHGLTFRDGQVLAGDIVALDNARIMTSRGTPNLAAAYSRATGFKGIPDVVDSNKLVMPIEYSTAGGQVRKESFYFTGGSTKSKAILNQAHGILTEWVQRANRLAESPFEMEPFATGIGKLRKATQKFLFGLDPTLAVKSGAALPTLGRMVWKWGILGTGAYLGYQTADWAVREADVLDNTPFAEGITAGIATAGIKANLLASQVADAIPGARAYQEYQEEVAPGSTSLTKLAALPLMGSLSGLTGAYLTTLWDRASITRELMAADQTLSLPQALAEADPIVAQRAKNFASETFDSLTMNKFKGRKVPFLGNFGRAKQFGFMGMIAGALLAAPFIPGALIPEYSADELEEIYSGKKEVPVRKGRFWELGRTPYEGTRIQYFRPHWYPRMLQRSYEKSLGIEDRSPFKQWLLENFTYDIEREQYYDRPYPITGVAFEDIPIIGPVLGATIGQLIKPQQLMHTEEWIQKGEKSFSSATKVLRLEERSGEGIRPDRGDTPPGTPIISTDLTQMLGEQFYRMTELIGLVGFSLSSIKNAITGSDEWFDQEERLQSARRMYGAERKYWDLSLGGGLGTTEFFRRLYPHRRRQIPEYNPIRNTMPEWLPGPGERSPDFRHGDPFTKIPEGELRLPGIGFVARFPELEGLDPENYPIAYKYKILSDVAPYTDRTSRMELIVRAAIKRGELTSREVELFKTAKQQMQEMKQSKKIFYQYQLLTGDASMNLPGTEGKNQSKEILALINENIKKREPEKSVMDTIVGGYWEGLIKSSQSPLEALTPLAPVSKLMHLQSAIEDYERTQVYGPDIAFWDEPIDNFIMPFIRESIDLAGGTVIPKEIERERQLKAYFDMLEYTKNTRLAQKAKEEALYGIAKLYEDAAEETLVGVNPYSRNFKAIFRALPRNERDYFNSFSKAKSIEDRERILELIPENEKRIYRAQWELMYTDELRKQLDKGLIPENLKSKALDELERLYENRHTEGFPLTPDLREEYESTKEKDETYGDWFRRTIIVQQAAMEGGLPGPDWVGWHPAVDLDDIKLKIIQKEGLDIHDFDLWESDARAAAHRDFFDDAAEELVETETPKDGRTESEVQAQVEEIFADLGISGQVHVYALESNNEENTYKIMLDLSELRDDQARDILEEMAA